MGERERLLDRILVDLSSERDAEREAQDAFVCHHHHGNIKAHNFAVHM